MIINNLTQNNHLHYLGNIFRGATDITIISPFITQYPDLFRFEDLQGLKSLTFVTTLKEGDSDQYSKTAYFKTLFTKLKASQVCLRIHIENTLHGKIYVAEYADGTARAIVTSANFTKRGLVANNEWGFLIEDTNEVARVRKGIFDRVGKKPIDEGLIDKCLQKIREIPKPENTAAKVELNLFGLLENISRITVGEKAQFWLKPIGATSEIIAKDRPFNLAEDRLHFSKVKPRGVKDGDILICYAVGHKNILAAFRVKSEILHTGNDNERWPNYMMGENLTPFYGGQWSEYNITISNQKDLVLEKGMFQVTPSGKNSYGSLMRGADKMRITREFGTYLLDKISELDHQIQSSNTSWEPARPIL